MAIITLLIHDGYDLTVINVKPRYTSRYEFSEIDC